MTVKRQETHRSCRLLQENENNDVFNLLGRRSVTLSTTVVQVYECTPNDRNWQKKCVGVVCFVKDNPRKSYYIRVVNISQRSVIWEQELYNQFKYNANSPQFHCFEGDNSVVGLNFADREEANHFRLAIEEKLAAKQQRKMERRQTNAVRRPPAPPAPAVTPSSRGSNLSLNSTNSVPTPTISPSNSSVDLKNKKNKSKGKKSKLCKEDIGKPSDFRHVGHVGWDPKAGFDVDNIDPQWKKLFDTVGVTQSELEDEETSKFIYDFVESHGGIEKATQELDKSKNQGLPPPPPPSRSAPGLPSRAPPRSSAPPPPPPSSRMPARSAPPPPPHSSRGAPPPPSRGGPPPPPPTSRAPPIPRGGPPPPPPMSGGGGPPPPPTP